MKTQFTRDFDLNFDGISMRAYTKTIDGVEVKFIGGTASSTAEDLYGSVIGKAAQAVMLEKLRSLAAQMSEQNSGLTAFLNHSYKIPEDTLGAFVAASLTTRADETGREYIDLDIECRVTDTNPRAVDAWLQVKDGIRHGWSIGAIFLDADYLSDDPQSEDYWTLLVTDINLLEISLVGIPANQRAWCKSADDLKAKAMAVKSAERIIRDATVKTMAAEPDGLGIKVERDVVDVVKQRALVKRSLLHADDDVADSATTAPITREAPEVVSEAAAAEGPSEDATGQTALAADVSAVVQPSPMTELSAELAGINVDSAGALVVGRAAEAINLLSAMLAITRDVGDTSPDDARGRIALAMSHLAKAVGHGLCVKSASHIAKALDCMAAVAGDGDIPTGDPENELAWAKLEPKAGDILVVRGSTPERIEQIREQLPDGTSVLYLPVGEAAELAAADAVQKAGAAGAELATTQASLEAANVALAAAQATLAQAQEEITAAEARKAELAAAIAKAEEKRLGRKSVNEVLAARVSPESEVQPADYQASHTERQAALRRMAAGTASSAQSGRDRVA